jgi:hypothetical protein
MSLERCNNGAETGGSPLGRIHHFGGTDP